MSRHMIRVLVVMGVLTSGFTCAKRLPNSGFTFKTKVKVVDGFYKGQSGIVLSYEGYVGSCPHTYRVKLEDPILLESTLICNDHLRKVDDYE